MNTPKKKCGQCKSYLGWGDWGLDCKKKYGLTNVYSDACVEFEQTDLCKNASHYLGWFFCSICGYSAPVDEVQNVYCPACRNRLGRVVDRA